MKGNYVNRTKGGGSIHTEKPGYGGRPVGKAKGRFKRGLGVLLAGALGLGIAGVAAPALSGGSGFAAGDVYAKNIGNKNEAAKQSCDAVANNTAPTGYTPVLGASDTSVFRGGDSLTKWHSGWHGAAYLDHDSNDFAMPLPYGNTYIDTSKLKWDNPGGFIIDIQDDRFKWISATPLTDNEGHTSISDPIGNGVLSASFSGATVQSTSPVEAAIYYVGELHSYLPNTTDAARDIDTETQDTDGNTIGPNEIKPENGAPYLYRITYLNAVTLPDGTRGNLQLTMDRMQIESSFTTNADNPYVTANGVSYDKAIIQVQGPNSLSMSTNLADSNKDALNPVEFVAITADEATQIMTGVNENLPNGAKLGAGWNAEKKIRNAVGGLLDLDIKVMDQDGNARPGTISYAAHDLDLSSAEGIWGRPITRNADNTYDTKFGEGMRIVRGSLSYALTPKYEHDNNRNGGQPTTQADGWVEHGPFEADKDSPLVITRDATGPGTGPADGVRFSSPGITNMRDKNGTFHNAIFNATTIRTPQNHQPSSGQLGNANLDAESFNDNMKKLIWGMMKRDNFANTPAAWNDPAMTLTLAYKYLGDASWKTDRNDDNALSFDTGFAVLLDAAGSKIQWSASRIAGGGITTTLFDSTMYTYVETTHGTGGGIYLETYDINDSCNPVMTESSVTMGRNQNVTVTAVPEDGYRVSRILVGNTNFGKGSTETGLGDYTEYVIEGNDIKVGDQVVGTFSGADVTDNPGMKTGVVEVDGFKYDTTGTKTSIGKIRIERNADGTVDVTMPDVDDPMHVHADFDADYYFYKVWKEGEPTQLNMTAAPAGFYPTEVTLPVPTGQKDENGADITEMVLFEISGGSYTATNGTYAGYVFTLTPNNTIEYVETDDTTGEETFAIRPAPIKQGNDFVRTARQETGTFDGEGNPIYEDVVVDTYPITIEERVADWDDASQVKEFTVDDEDKYKDYVTVLDKDAAENTLSPGNVVWKIKYPSEGVEALGWPALPVEDAPADPNHEARNHVDRNYWFVTEEVPTWSTESYDNTNAEIPGVKAEDRYHNATWYKDAIANNDKANELVHGSHQNDYAFLSVFEDGGEIVNVPSIIVRGVKKWQDDYDNKFSTRQDIWLHIDAKITNADGSTTERQDILPAQMVAKNASGNGLIKTWGEKKAYTTGVSNVKVVASIKKVPTSARLQADGSYKSGKTIYWVNELKGVDLNGNKYEYSIRETLDREGKQPVVADDPDAGLLGYTSEDVADWQELSTERTTDTQGLSGKDTTKMAGQDIDRYTGTVENTFEPIDVTVTKKWYDNKDAADHTGVELKGLLTLNDANGAVDLAALATYEFNAGTADAPKMEAAGTIETDPASGKEITITWKHLPKYVAKDGAVVPAAYYAVESDVAGYTTTYTNVDDTVTKDVNESSATDKAYNNGVITNAQRIKVNVEKLWDDADNQDGKRDDIGVTLFQNGVKYEATGVTNEATLADGDKNLTKTKTEVDDDTWTWEGVWTELPYADENGTPYNYTAQETTMPTGYESEAVTGQQIVVTEWNAAKDTLTFKVANKHDPEKVSFTVTKVWDDGDNQDGLRPADGEVTYTLKVQANGAASAQALTTLPDGATITQGQKDVTADFANGTIKVKTTATDGATITFTDLDKYAKAGNEITYTIEEAQVTGYEPPVISGNYKSGITVANKHVPETKDVVVYKEWKDDNDQKGIRPTQEEFLGKLALREGGGLVSGYTPVVTENGNKWTITWKDLPAKDQGRDLDYQVVETAVDGYRAVDANGTEIDYQVEIATGETFYNEVLYTITFIDPNPEDPDKPNTISEKDYPKGETPEDPTDEKDPDKDGSWKPDYPAYEFDGWDSTVDPVTGDKTYIAKYTRNIPVEKIWEDAKNQDGKRPESIKVNLLADGTKAQEGELKGDSWTYTFTKLPWKTKDNAPDGDIIKYEVEEPKVDGYEAEVTGDETNGFTITNKYTPEQVDIPVNKVWDDANNQDGKRPTNVVFELFADGVTTKLREILTAAHAAKDDPNKWSATFEALDKYKDGKEIIYTVIEALKDDLQKNGYGIDESKNNKDGNYTITNKYTPETVEIKATKVWDDENDKYGLRKDAEFILKADGKEVDKKTISKDATGDALTVTWEMPKYKDGGKEIAYTVVEDLNAMSPYSVEITGDAASGFIITNTYPPKTEEMTVTRTITYTYIDENGEEASATVTQTVTLQRVPKVINVETGEVEWGDWEIKDGDTNAVKSPDIEGWTPDKDVPKWEIDFKDPKDAEEHVVYQPEDPVGNPDETYGGKGESQTGTPTFDVTTPTTPEGEDNEIVEVTLLDDKGNPTDKVEVPEGTYTLNDDGTITFTPKDPEYVGDPTPVKVQGTDKNGKTATTTYTPHVVDNTEEVKRTITYEYADGTPVKDENGDPLVKEETITFTGTVDPKTGKVTYPDDEKEKSFPEEDSPEIDEYVPDKDPVKEDKVHPGDDDITEIVIYNPKDLTAEPDETWGLKGEPQTGTPTFNQETKTKPDGTPNKLTVKLVDPSTGEDTDTVTIPGQGTYVLNEDGTITFTPEPDFVGNPTPVGVRGTDELGKTARTTYTPHVVDPTDTGDATRTIHYTYLDKDGKQVTDDTEQSVTLTRHAKSVDPKTGVVTEWGDWEPGTFPAVENPDKEAGEGWTTDDKVDELEVTEPGDKGTQYVVYQKAPLDPPTGSDKETWGGKGETQSDKPEFTEGTGKIPEEGAYSLEDPDDDNPLKKTVQGEGTYTLNPDTGEVTFVPEPDFVSDGTGVTVKVTDENGLTATGKYTPHVVDNEQTEEVTRTITYEYNDGKPVLDKDGNPIQKTETLKFTRTGTVNPQTGEVTYKEDGSDWKAETTDTFDEVVSPTEDKPGDATNLKDWTPDRDVESETVKATDDDIYEKVIYNPKGIKPTPDESYGLKGEPQTGTPAFKPEIETLSDGTPNEIVETKLIDPSTGEPTDGPVTIDGQGTYTLNEDGTITFTPEPDYVGNPTPIGVTGTDKLGNTAKTTYTPHVVDPTDTGDATRTIHYTYMTEDGEIVTKDVVQTTTLTRHATKVDPKTGKATEWGPWTEATLPSETNPDDKAGEGWSTTDVVDELTVKEPGDQGVVNVVYLPEDPVAEPLVTKDGQFDSKDQDGNTPKTHKVNVNDSFTLGTKTLPDGTPNAFTFTLDVPKDEDGNPVPGATVSEDGTTVTVPGEGVYKLDPETGDITFTPDKDFTGKTSGVTVKGTDKFGKTAETTYTPIVVPNKETVTIEREIEYTFWDEEGNKVTEKSTETITFTRVGDYNPAKDDHPTEYGTEDDPDDADTINYPAWTPKNSKAPANPEEPGWTPDSTPDDLKGITPDNAKDNGFVEELDEDGNPTGRIVRHDQVIYTPEPPVPNPRKTFGKIGRPQSTKASTMFDITTPTTDKRDENGNLIPNRIDKIVLIDPDTGEEIEPVLTPVVDEDGNPVYETDEDGNVITDEDGNPVQKQAYPSVPAYGINPETGQREQVGTYTYDPEQDKVIFTPTPEFVGSPEPAKLKAYDLNGLSTETEYTPRIPDSRKRTTVDREITYMYQHPDGTESPVLDGNGEPLKVIQSVNFVREANVDPDTGELVWGPWEPETATMSEVVSPTEDHLEVLNKKATNLTGWTPDSDVEEFIVEIDPETDAPFNPSDRIIYYICGPTGEDDTSRGPKGQEQQGRPVFEKGSGEIPKEGAYSFPDHDEDDPLKKTVPGEGVYVLNPDTGDVTFTPEPEFVGTAKGVDVTVTDENDMTATAKYTPTVYEKDDERTVTRTIHYRYLTRDGEVASETVTQTVKFVRKTDPETGKLGDWEVADGDANFGEVISPDIDGYDVDRDAVDAITVSPDDKDMTEWVIYTPVSEPVTPTIWVTYIDPDGTTIYLEKTTEPKADDPSKQTEPDAPTDPTKEGFTFEGWDRSVDPEGNITYIAKWKPVEEPPVNPTPPEGTEEETWGPKGEKQSTTPDFKFKEGSGKITGYTLKDPDADNPNKKTVPGEGVYELNPETGMVTFTPEPEFTGKGSGVTVIATDENGLTAEGKYNPNVADVVETVTVKRIIEHVYNDGKPVLGEDGKPVVTVQERTFARVGKVDPKTGEVVWPEWSEKAELPREDELKLDGYRPNRDYVGVLEVTGEDAGKEFRAKIVYTPDSEITHTVTYVDSRTGEVIEIDTPVEHEGSSEVPTPPEHEGYKFTGWRTPTGELVTDLKVEDVITDLTYVAEYEPLPETVDKNWTVTYIDGRTGDVITVDKPVEDHGDSPVPVPPVHDGYRFKGWLTPEGELITDLTVTDVTRDLVYTAVYDQVFEEATTVARVIHYRYLKKDGKEVTEDHIDSVTFTRKAIVDGLTGETTWTEWEPKEHTFGKVDSPVKEKWTADTPQIPEQTVYPDGTNEELWVIYTPETGIEEMTLERTIYYTYYTEDGKEASVPVKQTMKIAREWHYDPETGEKVLGAWYLLEEPSLADVPDIEGFTPNMNEIPPFEVDLNDPKNPDPVRVVYVDEPATYWVTYVDPDGKTIYLEKTTVNRGEDEPPAPENPKKDGFVFNGWDRSVDKDGNITYTAIWVPEGTEPVEVPTEPETPTTPGGSPSVTPTSASKGTRTYKVTNPKTGQTVAVVTPARASGAKTGDSNNSLVWIVVAVAAAGAAVTAVAMRRRKRD